MINKNFIQEEIQKFAGRSDPEFWMGGFRREDGAWVWSVSGDETRYIQPDQM